MATPMTPPRRPASDAGHGYRPVATGSAPSTPMGRRAVATSNFTPRSARSSRNSSRNSNASIRGPQRPTLPSRSRIPPPRRMSTRLQLTLRGRLTERRRLSALTAAEADAQSNFNQPVGDEQEEEEDDDEWSDSDDDSDDERNKKGSATGESSSQTAGGNLNGDAQDKDAERKRRERRRLRRQRRLVWSLVDALRLVYYLISVPLRIGVFWDPFSTAEHNAWTHALTAFITMDTVADAYGIMRRWMEHKKRRERLHVRKRADTMLQIDGAERVDDPDAAATVPRVLYGQTVMDVVALTPIEIVLLVCGAYNALHIARLTKLFALRLVPSQTLAFILRSHARRTLGPLHRVLGRFLTSLVVIGAVWVHWSANIYVLIAHIECGLSLDNREDCASWAVDDQNRPVASGGGGGSHWRIYSRAVYWASRTIITLGFSDVVANPSRWGETFFTIIAEFAGAFWCACIIAGFAYWFTLQHRRGSKYSHDMFVHRVDHLLGRPHFGLSNGDGAPLQGSVVPAFLRRRIVEYLKHEWTISRSFHEHQCRRVVRQEQLQQSLQCELKTAKLLRLPCFSRQSIGFLNALAGEMKIQSLSPLDWVIEYPGTQSVFFVVLSGSVAVVSAAHQDEKIYTCNPGDSFGVITLFNVAVLKEKAFAEEFSEILVLDADGLERVLTSYYHDKLTTAKQQRDEMHSAAQEDYTAFSDKCRRRHERQSIPVTTTTIPHRDAVQLALELAPLAWQHSQSSFRSRWEVVRCLALLYLTFEVPYIVVFFYGSTSSSYFGDGIDWRFSFTFACSAIVEIFFYVDLYLRCREFEPRKKVNSLTFYLDAVANLPLALVVDIYDGCTHGALSGGWRWLSLFRLIRLLRVRQLKKRVVSTLPRATGVAQFIIYCALAILVYCHAVACVWYLTGHYSLDTQAFSLQNVASGLPSKPECLRLAQQYSNCSWTVMDGMEAIYDDGDRRFLFLRSMYFSVSTFTTVAYGDILPFSTGETWVAAIATYIGGILCYTMFGAMGAAIERLARRRRETRYENHLRARVLELNQISRKLRSEINRFQAFRAKTLADHELEEELLAYVSPGLRAELSACLYRNDVEKFTCLHGASAPFRDAVAAHMKRRFYFKGDTIFSAGCSATEMMVIRHGHVQLVDGDSQIVVTVLVNGATLGEQSCVCPTELLLVDYVADTVTEVAVISREALEEIWKHFPTEKERMVSNENEGNRLQKVDSLLEAHDTNDASNALSRIHIQQDSPGKASIAEFQERVRWQRAINGNTFRSKWEVLIGAVVIYNTFAIVARVAFSPSPSKQAMVMLTTIDYVFDVALLIDIYLKSFHFLAPADLLSVSSRIFSPKQIRSYYYRDGWMVWDLLASLPLYYIGSNYAMMTYFRVPRLLRALQIVEIGERVHSGLLQRLTVSTSSAGVVYSLMGLGKVLMVLLLCCHIGGSVFYAISSHESADSGRTAWVTGDVVILQHVGNLSVAYLRSFYWAISTFTVVNYGDIVATTVRETLWACLICLMGTFFMSKVIGDIVDLLQSLDRCASEHRERVEQFEYVAQRRTFPDDLIDRGQAFLNYEYEVTHGLPAPETLFCSLPYELQTQVYNEMYGSILRRVPLFQSLTDGQIRELAAAPWRTDLFTPNDIIVYENSLADALFVMKEGRAQMHRFSSGLAITQIQSGELFGEAMFFTPDEDLSGETSGPRRMVSVQALTYCEVLRLDREAWLRFMAMRASNREAGRRVLEFAQGEQLKYRAVLQKLGSYLDLHRAGDETNDHAINDSSSHSSGEDLDAFDGDMQLSTSHSRPTHRDVRIGSAPNDQQQPGQAPPNVRRFGSSPALFSQIARQLSFPKNSRRTSDGYTAVSTPVVPVAQVEPRRAVSSLNILKRFGSPRNSRPDDYELREGGAAQDAVDSQPPKETVRFQDSSPFCYRWDAVKFFAIVYYVAALPLRVSFYDAIERAAETSSGDGERAMTIWIVLEYVIVDGFLWLDIFMRLFVFTPTVRGEPLTIGRQRREWYVRHGSFVIDLLGSFPFELLSLLPFDAFHQGAERGQIVAAAIRLTTLIRCFQLEPLWWRLERQLVWFEKDTLTTLKIAFIGVLSSHWIACLWYFVGHASMPSNSLSWLTAPNMLAPDPTGTGAPLTEDQVNNVSMLNKYLRSYHFAIGSISTTTYGDIVSRNVAETLAQLVVTFLCIVFYGYVTTGVRQILSRKFARTIALEQDEAQIRGFARHYGLSRSLVAAIRGHLRERWRQESDVDQRAVADLVHAPLRRDIAAYLRNALFETEEPKTNVFEKLPEVMVTTLLSELREEAYGEDEIIYEQFAVGRVMYFVESGSVLLTTEHRDQSTDKCVKTQGDYFGESCVVDRPTNGSERRATAVAQTDCRLAVLDVEAFERVLRAFPTHAATLRAAWSPPVRSYAV